MVHFSLLDLAPGVCQPALNREFILRVAAPETFFEHGKTGSVHENEDRGRESLDDLPATLNVDFEDLAPTGFTAAQLGEHGTAHDRWPAIEKALIARAQQRVSFNP